MRKLFLLASLLIAPLVSAQELHTFSNGEVADAEKINENFRYISENLTTQPSTGNGRNVLGLTSVAVASVGIVNKTRQCIADYGASAAICEEREVIYSPKLVDVADSASGLTESLPDGSEAPLQAVWVLPTLVSVENFNRTYLTLSSEIHFSYSYDTSAGLCPTNRYDYRGFALDTSKGVGAWIECDRITYVLCCGIE